MGFYETTYILHSALQEGRLNDIINVIEKKTQSIGAEILYSDNWGRKKLSYMIDKQKYGTYILCQYSLNCQDIKDISQELELNPNILRYLTTKINEPDIKEGSNKLEISKVVETENNKFSNKDKQDINKEENNKSIIHDKKIDKKDEIDKN